MADKTPKGVMLGGTFVPLPQQKPAAPAKTSPSTVSRDAILAQFGGSYQQKPAAPANTSTSSGRDGVMVGGTFVPLPKKETSSELIYSPFISPALSTVIVQEPKSVSPTPPQIAPALSVSTIPAPAVKTSTTDNILFDQDDYPDQLIYDLLYEDISSQELISISRSDIINGQKILYQPIKNLSSIQQQYNPNNILSLQQTSNTYFAGFSINLADKIPDEGNGLNGENIYINSAGELIIELINLNSDEQVEIQIALSGTIYEANLGDYAS